MASNKNARRLAAQQLLAEEGSAGPQIAYGLKIDGSQFDDLVEQCFWLYDVADD